MLAALVPAVGVLAYLRSGPHQLHDPDHALQQLDLLYLDQPAPGAAGVDLPAGRPVVLLFCLGCAIPDVDGADVISVDDRSVAAAYGLAGQSRAPGGLGPGYALIDGSGRVRYRTYDPDPGAHAAEVQRLLDGMAASATPNRR